MEILRSNRFRATIIGIACVVLMELFGLSENASTEVVALIIAFVAGDSYREIRHNRE